MKRFVMTVGSVLLTALAAAAANAATGETDTAGWMTGRSEH